MRNALCIGINEFADTDNDLVGCVNDANDWSRALNARGFSVKSLLDGEATGKAIRESISALIDSTKSGVAVVHFSGHGTFVPDLDGDEVDGTDEAICPTDVVKNGVITDDQLNILFQAHPGVRVVFIADSCNSGTVARFAPITTPPTTRDKLSPRRTVRFMPPATFLSKHKTSLLGRRLSRPASPPGRQGALLMSGCTEYESSYDAYFNGRASGVFSFVALRELARLPASATYRQWHAAIRRVLPNRQYVQTPGLYGTTAMKSCKVFT